MTDLCLTVLVSSLFAGSFVIALYDTRTDHDIVVVQDGMTREEASKLLNEWVDNENVIVTERPKTYNVRLGDEAASVDTGETTVSLPQSAGQPESAK